MISTSKKLSCVSAITMALASAGASALPVSELFFSQAAGWDTSGFTFNPGGTGYTGLDFSDGVLLPGAPAGTSTNSKWCESAAQAGDTRCSSIQIDSFTSDTTAIRLQSDLTTPDLDGWNEGDVWVIDTLTQTNQALRTGSTIPDPLWIADTVANLRIFDDMVGGNQVSGNAGFLDSRVSIEFWESNNLRNADNCPGPNPLGTACDDVYRIAATDFSPVTFNLDGYIYTIEFGLLPLESTAGDPPVGVGPSLVCPNVLDPRCDGVVVDAGEIWVYTPENNPGTSSIAVTMSWSAVAVSTPAALALLGIGALAAGFAGRRRNS